MNIVQINASYNIGSTGRIMKDLDAVIDTNGNHGYMVSAYGASNSDISSKLYSINNSSSNTPVKINLLVSRITGVMGYRHKRETQDIIEWIESKKPDIVHLHNIHGDWINLETLFSFLQRKKIPVVWTLHDCWAFTGRCSHFENCGCEKWKTGCYQCHNKKIYPITYFIDRSQKMWADKKKLFTSINNLTIVTPSDWLGKYVKQSFLANYPVITIHNGIDLSTFQPRLTGDKKQKMVGTKKMILGVAGMWTERKGLFDFYKLADLLGLDYQVVLVGLNSRQMDSLPENIIGISRTNSVIELSELYSMADYYVNMTYLDNYPTTNLEAQACGTPTITYRTGGSPESVQEADYVVDQGNVGSVAAIITRNDRKTHEYYRENAVKSFGAEKCFASYLQIYKSVLKASNEEI